MVEIIRSRRVTTASYLADRMNVSIRTIYRYINDLCLSGIPIVSETGVGYRLDKSFDMPRLMFTEEELLALSLGAKLVQKCSDEYLSDAAKSLLQKVQSTIPQHKKHVINQITLHAPSQLINEQQKKIMSICRTAIDKQCVLHIQYSDAKETKTQRAIRPLGLAFWGNGWTLASWCEIREDFRVFRLDRIHSACLTTRPFSINNEISLDAFIHYQME